MIIALFFETEASVDKFKSEGRATRLLLNHILVVKWAVRGVVTYVLEMEVFRAWKPRIESGVDTLDCLVAEVMV